MIFTSCTQNVRIQMSMDRCRRWMDNVFVKHLSCSLKQKDIYLMGYADGRPGARRDRLVGGLYNGPRRITFRGT
jgi:hypothetical protein